jgi:hypothetical protein
MWAVTQRVILGFAAAALALVVGLAINGAVISDDGYTATSRSAIRHADFGFPMTAVTQDQYGYAHQGAYPRHLTIGSPWEVPTNVHPIGLFIDIALAGVSAAGVIAVAGFFVVTAVRRIRPRRTDARPAPA